MWVFGYGSLIWKVDFPFKSRLVGFIKGYVRRFWQGSEDHRGVPGKPGRVVTLLPADDSEAEVWGVAYEIDKSDEEFVTKHLDIREKDGYEKVAVTFHPSNENNVEIKPFELFIYIGSENNRYFAGAADVQTIAKQIVEAVGPSGTNTEYVYQLASAMRKLAPNVKDEHLFSVERAVRQLDKEKEKPQSNGS